MSEPDYAAKAKELCRCLPCQRLSSRDSMPCRREAIEAALIAADKTGRDSAIAAIQEMRSGFSINRLDDMLIADPDGEWITKQLAYAAIRSRAEKG